MFTINDLKDFLDNNRADYEIMVRKLRSEELPAAQALIWGTFLAEGDKIASEQGRETFKAFLNDALTLEALCFWGAFRERKLLGVLAADEAKRHIVLLFVAVQEQRQGIGRLLYEHAVEQGGWEFVYVNAAPPAAAFYAGLGFVPLAEKLEYDGIYYIPMRCRH